MLNKTVYVFQIRFFVTELRFTCVRAYFRTNNLGWPVYFSKLQSHALQNLPFFDPAQKPKAIQKAFKMYTTCKDQVYFELLSGWYIPAPRRMGGCARCYSSGPSPLTPLFTSGIHGVSAG